MHPPAQTLQRLGLTGTVPRARPSSSLLRNQALDLAQALHARLSFVTASAQCFLEAARGSMGACIADAHDQNWTQLLQLNLHELHVHKRPVGCSTDSSFAHDVFHQKKPCTSSELPPCMAVANPIDSAREQHITHAQQNESRSTTLSSLSQHMRRSDPYRRLARSKDLILQSVQNWVMPYWRAGRGKAWRTMPCTCLSRRALAVRHEGPCLDAQGMARAFGKAWRRAPCAIGHGGHGRPCLTMRYRSCLSEDNNALVWLFPQRHRCATSRMPWH